MAKFVDVVTSPDGAKLTKTGRVQKNKTEQKFRKAELKRYKAETKAASQRAAAARSIAKRNARANRKIAKIHAQNERPIEVQKMKASVAKHAAWAATASDIIGKGAQTYQQVNTANANQNVNGGLSGTSDGRDDSEDDKDDGNLYKVYKGF